MNNMTTTAIWLASAAAAIHIIVGALQSNSFNALLAQFSLPAIPQKAFPWIGVLLGLGGGVVSGLQQGQVWTQALATAVLGMLSGGASALHVETMGGNVTNVPKPKVDGGSGGVADSKKDSEKPVVVVASVPPTAKRMRFLFPAFGAFAFISIISFTTPVTTGCAWFKANSSSVVTDLDQTATCVVAQLFQGITNPATITGSCVGATLAQVDAIITSIINYYSQPTVVADSGAATASGQLCGSGTIPYKGMPSCVSISQLSSFKALHAQYSVQLAGGSH